MPKINPYYNPEQLGLDLISFDEPGLCYEFNTLCFWATNDGQVFTAQDSGCSCPTPFEGYAGETQKEVLQGLERIGSPDQVEGIFDAWNGRRDDRKLPQSCKQEAIDWVKSRLTSK